MGKSKGHVETQQPQSGGPGQNQQLLPEGPGGWMAIPETIEGCPKGLEYLAMVDQLIIQQQVELLEAFTSFETNNRYEVKNTFGQKVFVACEETNCCARICCGPSRGFHMKLMDNFAKTVMTIDRPLRCSTCWFPCCLQRAEVQAPPGHTIGYIEQTWSVCRPKYRVLNADGQTVLRIVGPCFTCNLCGDIEFQVLTADSETQVGEIRKQWSGLVKEAFTDADNFGITFPTDLDVGIKGTLLGAVFLIDFMFFEKRGNKPESKNMGMTGMI